MKIVGKNLTLVPVEVEDALLIEEIRSNSNITGVLNSILGIDQTKWIEEQKLRKNDFYFKCIDKDDQVVGLIGLYDIAEGYAEWGRLIFRERSFLVFEAISLLLKFAAELKIERVYCRTKKINIPVCSMHERLPYTYLSLSDLNFQICVLDSSNFQEFFTLLERYTL